MAFKLDWSQQAFEDLRDMVGFLSEYDPEIARSFSLRIIERLEATTAFPRSGQVVPEKEGESIREILLTPYRLIYSIDDSKQMLSVVRIWHAARGTPEI